MAPITINDNTLDSERDRQTLLDLGIDLPDAAKSNYILVQAHSALDRGQKLEIEALGPKILQHVSDATYLCRYDPDNISHIEDKPYIKWVNIYPEAFVVPPSLKSSEPPPAANGLAALAPPLVSDRPRDLILTLHPDINTISPALRDKIAEAAHVDQDSVHSAHGQVRLRTEERRLDALAKIDNTTYGLKGESEIVAVADTGFDKGLPGDVHPAFLNNESTANPKPSHALSLYGIGRPSKADDPDGHGTHVCGSVLGSQTFGDKTTIEGTAPKARLVVQSIFTGFGDKGTDAEGNALLNAGNLYELFQKPYDKDGARIHTNSWGSEDSGQYNAGSAALDKFVYDHPDMVVLFAAGNAGFPDIMELDKLSNGQIGSQPFAKICITVGASENYRPDFEGTYGALINPLFSGPIKADKIADKPYGMAAFSSRGFVGTPTKARVKPDVAAPGTCILSTKSRAISPDSNILTKTINVNLYGTSPYPDYFKECGTSIATPLVAGCCALIREALRRNRDTGQIDPNAKPSAALIKALLINGASELKGQYQYPVKDAPGKSTTEAGRSPNPGSGWGSVWIPSALQASANAEGFPSANYAENAYQGYIDNQKGVKEGEKQSQVIRIPDVTQNNKIARSAWNGHAWTETKKGLQPTLKVTLVWSDPPGPPAYYKTETLQNQLRLAVKVGNQKRHGNRDDNSWDDKNNVQQVVWEKIPAGQVTLEISTGHFTRTNAMQQFAVVWCLLLDREEWA